MFDDDDDDQKQAEQLHLSKWSVILFAKTQHVRVRSKKRVFACAEYVHICMKTFLGMYESNMGMGSICTSYGIRTYFICCLKCFFFIENDSSDIQATTIFHVHMHSNATSKKLLYFVNAVSSVLCVCVCSYMEIKISSNRQTTTHSSFFFPPFLYYFIIITS